MNKKVVFLVVLLECLLAVLIVNLFGHVILDPSKQIVCKDLYFSTESGEKIEDGEIIEYSLTDSNISYQLYWVMEATDVSNKEVVFESNHPMVKVNSLGLVTFIEEVSVIITVRAVDGSGKMDSIALVPAMRDVVVD